MSERKEHILVVLTPPRPEFVKEFETIAKDAASIIAELPYGELINEFLQGSLPVDDALLELELDYPFFTRELLLCLRRLKENGKDILLVDPYQEIAVDIKVKLFLRKGLEKLEQDLTARYIAMIELSISKILQEYEKARKDGDFDKLVELTIRYAKFDAERIRFKTELRVRKIIELINMKAVKFPLVVHTHFLNRLIAQELQKRLGDKYEISEIDLYEIVQKRLNMASFEHPGRKLTEVFLLHRNITREELQLLAAKTLLFVTLYPKHELLPTPTEPFPMLKKDFEISKMLSNVSNIEECKNLYQRLTQKP